jgi:hypothetical protein
LGPGLKHVVQTSKEVEKFRTYLGVELIFSVFFKYYLGRFWMYMYVLMATTKYIMHLHSVQQFIWKWWNRTEYLAWNYVCALEMKMRYKWKWKSLFCLNRRFQITAKRSQSEARQRGPHLTSFCRKAAAPMLTSFGEKMAFFSKTNVMITFFHNLALFWLKKPIFGRKYFFLNRNIGPWETNLD